jgi:hypothetical protein
MSERDVPTTRWNGTGPDSTRVGGTSRTVPAPRAAAPRGPSNSDPTVPIHRQEPFAGAADPTDPTEPTRPTGPTELTQPPDPSEPAVLVRFGPGVPASRSTPAAVERPKQVTGRRHRGWRAVNLALTGALALVVLWLLWPSAPVEVRQVTVRAPSTVGCQGSADVVATLQTNGRPGEIRYRWVRNDGVRSDVLTTSAPDGRDAVDVSLRWAFTGPGSYAADVALEVVEPTANGAAASFTYRC